MRRMPDDASRAAELADDRDFTVGAPSARRSVVWYETYEAGVPPIVRDILRRAVARAARSTGGAFALRMLPPPGDERALALARAVVAAGWQGRAVEMHRTVTARDVGPNLDGLRDAARKAGLDLARWERDRLSERTERWIAEDRALAAQAGFDEGPLLFIDGRLYTGVLDEAAVAETLERPLGLRLRQAGADFFRWAAAGGVALILATFLALVVANTGLHGAYEALRDGVLSLGWNDARFALTAEEWVNDGLMTLFFLIVGIEIKREVVAGELSDPRRAALPIAAALGGMAVPAAVFVALNLGEPTAGGWGVPMATDIAFTLGLLALLGDRVPASLRIFVSALAIADDLGAIVVIALFYSDGVAWVPLGWAALILLAMAGLNRARVYALWPYLALGVLLWAAIFAGGLHATLAGVLTAMAIPSRQPAAVEGVAVQTQALMRREAARAEAGEGFAHHTLERMGEILERLREPGERVRHGLETWTNFLVLPLFAFLNTGLVFAGSNFDLTAPVSLGIVAGLVVGKPVGICLAAWIVLRLGVATAAPDIRARHLVGAACLCGIGFTMSIFIAGAAFEGAALDAAKLSVLVASVLSALIGMAVLWGAGPVADGSDTQPAVRSPSTSST